ncbi:uncharacterized protein LOC129741388 [Uranotaenia lowii]|uniref:uncharacterized protein LOC129741388 n=1 Tax=Uranotaenia lowii TaxID=190385 RepID=UPI00247A36ED|nr:uncharacterized protein LOC129741388 [Uranotaenia lowii]
MSVGRSIEVTIAIAVFDVEIKSQTSKLGDRVVSTQADVVDNVVRTIDESPNNFPRDHTVSADEIKATIRRSKNIKAPGFDGILNIVLKHLSSNAYQHLSSIFNRCLELGYFPLCWKLAKVTPILKPGKDPTSPKSYRPISLLSSLSKLFEKIIQSRILDFADTNHVFLEEQFGFRKGRSTVHQLTRVTDIIRCNKAVSKTSIMALLDVEKAFDNVWHNGLICKLKRFNFPIFLVKIIRNYLTTRSFQVSICNTCSDTFNIHAGVPQGSILGPILFNIFTSDIPELPDGGQLSLFADDTAIIYKGRIIRSIVNKLQNGLDVLAEYFNNWKICINAAKTQSIVFPHSKSPKLVPPEDVKIRLGEGVCVTKREWNEEDSYAEPGLRYSISRSIALSPLAQVAYGSGKETFQCCTSSSLPDHHLVVISEGSFHVLKPLPSNPRAPWVTNQLRQLMTAKNRALRNFSKHKSLCTKEEYRMLNTAYKKSSRRCYQTELSPPTTAHIFRASLDFATFPSLWKEAYMFPVHKNGNKKDVNNYRGISALCSIAKLFELVVLDPIFSSSKQYFSNDQHGFLPKRSTTTNLLTFTSFAQDSFTMKSQTDAIYTDLSTAFDKRNPLHAEYTLGNETIARVDHINDMGVLPRPSAGV